MDEAASATRSTKTFAPPAAAVEPPCVCGEPSRSQVTYKEGANKGRVFYSCRKPRLGYFLLRSRVVMDKSCKCSFFIPFHQKGGSILLTDWAKENWKLIKINRAKIDLTNVFNLLFIMGIKNNILLKFSCLSMEF